MIRKLIIRAAIVSGVLFCVVIAGAETSVQTSTMVISATLQPVVGNDGNVHLTINQTGIGNLPLPHETLLEGLSEYADLSTGKMRLDVSGTTPPLVVDLTGQSRNKVPVRSVQVEDGAMAIEFGAPDLNGPASNTDRLARC